MGAQRQPKVELFVEGAYDAEFLAHLFPRAKLDSSQIQVHVSGRDAIRQRLHARPSADETAYVALLDADQPNVPDAREHARRELGNPHAEVFCAVPSIEAWLFADPDALLECVEGHHARDIIGRLPLPEQIPYPAEMAARLFPDPSASFCAIDRMDLCRAAARSPSLHAFLRGMARITGQRIKLPDDVHARSLGRDTFSNLIAEIAPADTIVYRTVDGSTFTAEQMIHHIREGTATGRQYASDLLRVSRDFLARQARR